MQDYPESIQLLASDETEETPNWVSAAGSANWQPRSLASYRPADVSAEAIDPGQLTGAQESLAFARDFRPVPQYADQHRFYGETECLTGAPYWRQSAESFSKPYVRPVNPAFVPPEIAKGLPLLDFNQGLGAIPKGMPLPDAPSHLRAENQQQNGPDVHPLQIARVGDQVIIATFSRQDPDLDAKNAPRLVPYDINSPEAKLYLQNLESVVKITVEKVGADGKPTTATGTGFFVTEKGEIATAYHVIDGARSIRIQAPSGWAYNARVKEGHSPSEAAILELTNATPGEKFRPIPLRDTASDLHPDDKLTVLGHPNGVDDVVMSMGNFVSRERIGSTPFSLPNINPNAMFFHADTRIQGGNSGGPILDSQGRVVGLTNFKHDDKTGEFLGIDEVRSMITDPEKGRLSDQRSYVFPATLQFDADTGWKAWETFMSGTNAFNAYVGRGNNYAYISSATRGFASTVIGGVALSNMPKDYKVFKSALEFGSTAEKVSAGLDLGGDLLMAGGSLTAILSKRLALVGTTISTVGAGSRFVNALFSDRRYH